MKVSARMIQSPDTQKEALEIQLGKVTRIIENPKTNKPYKFIDKGEEYFFIYEEIRVMRHVNRKLYLYPLDIFKPPNNVIEL